MSCKISDSIKKARAQIEADMEGLLHTIGKAGHESILNMIDNGYDEPVKDTGALRAEQIYYVDSDKGAVYFGVPMGAKSALYARFVHEGTVKMEARPFIRDGLVGMKNNFLAR